MGVFEEAVWEQGREVCLFLCVVVVEVEEVGAGGGERIVAGDGGGLGFFHRTDVGQLSDEKSLRFSWRSFELINEIRGILSAATLLPQLVLFLTTPTQPEEGVVVVRNRK